MKNFFTIFLFIYSVLIFRLYSEPYLGNIPVQYANAGAEFILDMHRFYQPEKGYELEFENTENYKLFFDKKSFELRINISDDFTGLLNIPIKLTNSDKKIISETILTIIAKKRIKHKFFYKSEKKLERISVAGTFNNWNSNTNFLTDDDNDNIYECYVYLDPGLHYYKFVINSNEWIADPENPEKEVSGYGNSILKLGEENKTDNLFIFPAKETENEFIIEILNNKPKIFISSILQKSDLIGGSKICNYQLKNNEIIINKKDTENFDYLRIIISDETGNASNIVRIILNKNEKKFLWQDAIMYFAFTDRFYNYNKENDAPIKNENLLEQVNYLGGDFAGITKKIEDGYFEKIGVNVIWLSPVNKNPDTPYQEYQEPYRYYTGYHGYWPISHKEIEPRFGTKEELKKLVETAHNKNIKVLVDLVLNHTHIEHPFYKEHPEWYGSMYLPDGRRNLRLWDEHPFTTWFEPFLPSFDFSKPELEQALLENTIWWLNEFDFDGFRLDAVKHIPPSFWYKFRTEIREKYEKIKNKKIYLIGETFMSREGIMNFVGPNMLDGQFDFPLYDIIKEVFALSNAGFKELDASLSSSEKIYGKDSLMAPLIGNHDKARFMAYADGDLPDPMEPDEEEVGWKKPPIVDDPRNYKKIKLAFAFLFSLDGVPMVYYGDEFGLTGAGDPDNRRKMRFDDNLSDYEIDVLEYFSKLTKIRNENPALRYGARRTIYLENDIYAFIKTYFDNRIVVIFNNSDNEKEIELNVRPEIISKKLKNLITKESIDVNSNGIINIKIPAKSAIFLK